MVQTISDISEKSQEQFVEITSKRYEEAVKKNPVSFAANLLDHRFTGNNLDTEDVSNDLKYIKDVDVRRVPEVMKFMSNSPLYNTAYFAWTFKDADPVSWWNSGVKMGFDQNLAKVAISLMSAASSSGGLERCFSTPRTSNLPILHVLFPF